MARASFPLTFLLMVVCGVTVNIKTTAAAKITDCSNKKYIDGVDDVTVTCEPSIASATIEWVLSPTGGPESTLATCNGVTNCANNGRAKFTNDGTRSILTYSKVTKAEGGTIKCKEGSEVVECTVEVIYVKASCGEKEEDSAFTVTCDTSPETQSSVKIERSQSNTNEEVNCTAAGSCYASGINDVTVERTDEKMTYKIKHVTRAMHGDRMTCTFTYNGQDEKDSCPVKVYHAANITNCQLAINSNEWKGTLSCDFSQWWAGSGEYEYAITRTGGGNAIVARSPVPAGELVSYTDNGKAFKRGRLSKTFDLPADGSNTYILTLYPGGEEGGQTSPSGGVTIKTPSTPTLTCASKVSAANVTVTTCSCEIADIGKPEGRLAFKVGTTVVHRGIYGDKKVDFPTATYTCGGMGTVQTTCYVDWVETKDAPGAAKTVSCKPSSSAYGISGKWSTVAGGLLMVLLLLSQKTS
ncbi:uncharacterized protein [Littorina saxatilis]|uniref:Uncharacterized protein n=1 Tax=Littorina saxatilis TaxID=31220 RepID=A0AAN9AV86_9CAEN